MFFLRWFILCFTGLVITTDGNEQDDWTTGCPKLSCKCKWVSGKRTALCQSAALTSLPNFKQPEKIQVLHMEYNRVQILPEKVFKKNGLLNIQKVYLQNCNLSKIHPDAFQDLTLLIELDLSHNRLNSLLPGTFQGNIRIRKLWISHNPIHSLSRFSFPVIDHIRLLDLSHCKLSKLKIDTFKQLDKLEVLQLNDNLFRHLEKSVFKPITNLKSLTLERNPWQCDCKLYEFWHWIMANNLFNLPTACATPKKLTGISWDNLDDSSLACTPKIYVPEPMVTVSSQDMVRLSCLASGNAHLSWVRAGVVIVNNTRSAEEGSQQFYKINRKEVKSSQGVIAPAWKTLIVNGSQVFRTPIAQMEEEEDGDLKRTWFNLTIKNLHPSGSGVYTCVAQNPGGMSEGNVTVVYSESVATYLERSEMSVLLVMGVSTGALVFLCIGVLLACFITKVKYESNGQRNTRGKYEKSRITSGDRAEGMIESNSMANGHRVRLKIDDGDEFEMCQMLKSTDQETGGTIISSSHDSIDAQSPSTSTNNKNHTSSFDSAMSNGDSSNGQINNKQLSASKVKPGNSSPSCSGYASSSVDSTVSSSTLTPSILNSPPSSLGSVTIASNPTTSLMERMWRQEIGSRTHLLHSNNASFENIRNWTNVSPQHSTLGYHHEWCSNSLSRKDNHRLHQQQQQLEQEKLSPISHLISTAVPKGSTIAETGIRMRQSSHTHPLVDNKGGYPLRVNSHHQQQQQQQQQHTEQQFKHHSSLFQQHGALNAHFSTSNRLNRTFVSSRSESPQESFYISSETNKRTEVLAQEVRERKRLLEALVKDKSDTVV